MVAVQTIYVNKTVTALTNNIEIVSPYISDLEYKKLKSAFHLMNSRADYDSLCDSLNKIADENQLQLNNHFPNSQPIMIAIQRHYSFELCLFYYSPPLSPPFF